MTEIDYHKAALQARKSGYNPDKYSESSNNNLEINTVPKILNSEKYACEPELILTKTSSPEAIECGKSLKRVLMSKNGQRRLSQL